MEESKNELIGIDRQEEKLKKLLEEYYPHKTVGNLTKHNDVYHLLKTICKRREIESLEELLKQYGYKYKRENKVNIIPALILRDVFNVIPAEIARHYDCERENIRQLLEKNVDKEISFADELSKSEIEIVEKMIVAKSYSHKGPNVDIELIHNFKGNFAFRIRTDDTIKMVTDTGFELKYKELFKQLEKSGMNKLHKKEMQLKDTSKIIKALKEEHLQPAKDLAKFATKRNMSKEEYAMFLGYKGFLDGKFTNADDRIIRFFDDNMLDNGKVYAPTDEIQWLRNYAKRVGFRGKEGFENFVAFFGYEWHSNRDKKVKNSVPKKMNKYRRKTRTTSEILKDIERRAKSKDTSKGTSQKKENHKIDRDSELVKRLKRLYYGGICQICKNQNIKTIKKSNGEIYSEAHHIKPLSEALDTIEYENMVYDDYKNMIILCPYHHRYLHYNKGGNYKLKMIDNELFLVNDKDKVKIQLDKHLKRNFD